MKMLHSYVRSYFKAFPSLYVIGVRPIGQELLSGPWCKSNHKDWNKPCKGKPHLAPVWECLGSFHFWLPIFRNRIPKSTFWKGEWHLMTPRDLFCWIYSNYREKSRIKCSGLNNCTYRTCEFEKNWKVKKFGKLVKFEKSNNSGRKIRNLKILEMKPKK